MNKSMLNFRGSGCLVLILLWLAFGMTFRLASWALRSGNPKDDVQAVFEDQQELKEEEIGFQVEKPIDLYQGMPLTEAADLLKRVGGDCSFEKDQYGETFVDTCRWFVVTPNGKRTLATLHARVTDPTKLESVITAGASSKFIKFTYEWEIWDEKERLRKEELAKQTPEQRWAKLGIKIPSDKVKLRVNLKKEEVVALVRKIGADIDEYNSIYIKDNAGLRRGLGKATFDSNKKIRFLDIDEPSFLEWDGPEVAKFGEGATMSKFMKIRQGMDELEVFGIVGEYGELVSSSGSIESYVWRAKEGVGNMVVTFRDGIVTSKAQLGLK
jgi:hypothetical protein